VAQSSFQHFPRRRFRCVTITTCYHSMPQSRHQKTVQSPVITAASPRDTTGHHSNTTTCQKHLQSQSQAPAPQKQHGEFLFTIEFQQQDKMQRLGKFKKTPYKRFRATLLFQNFKVVLNPMYRTFPNPAKSCIPSRLQKLCCFHLFSFPYHLFFIPVFILFFHTHPVGGQIHISSF